MLRYMNYFNSISWSGCAIFNALSARLYFASGNNQLGYNYSVLALLNIIISALFMASALNTPVIRRGKPEPLDAWELERENNT